MAESTTAVVAALVGNAALAVLKGASAAFTGSAAMLAETCHSIADTGNEALLLLGMRLGARPPDEAHPFGYGKDVYFWAFVVSVMLFTLGGGFSIWEAVRHYLHPRGQEPLLWAYSALGGAFVFESVSFGFAVRALRRVKRDRSFTQYWRDSRDPTLATVLLEDGAALVCLVIAGAGLWMTARTGNGLWDAAGSALIGVLLLVVALVLAIENYSLLLGEAATPRVERAIRGVVERDPAVIGVGGLHTMHVGPKRILVVIAVAFARQLRTPEVEAAVARLHRGLAAALGAAVDPRLIAIEPTPADALSANLAVAAPALTSGGRREHGAQEAGGET